MAPDDETLGNLTRAQLKNDLSALLDDKLSILVTTLATKADLENISGKVATLAEENRSLRAEIVALKAQGKAAASKLVDLESRSRRNNLIFKGLKCSENTRDYRTEVEKFCREVLGVKENLWINRAHPLGKNGNAIIAHIPTDSEVDYIMSRVRKLKGTGFMVHRDFPVEIRQKRSCLMNVRAEVERVAGRRRMPLVFDHLIIEGCRFTWEDGVLRAGQQDGAVKLSSLFNHDFKDFLATLTKQTPGWGGVSAESSSANISGASTAAAAAVSTGQEATKTVVNGKPAVS